MIAPEAIAGSNVDWANQTVLHPVGFALVVAAGLAMIVVPRRYAVWPMLAIACFVAPAQRVSIAELDFNLLRILVLFGWVRLFVHDGFRGFVLKPLDRLILLWAAASTLIYTLQRGSTGALIGKLGESFDAVGMYFLFRCLIQSWSDVRSAMKGLVVCSVPVAAAFLLESATGRNLFAFFGGVPEITIIREGRLRCQGAFAHPILAGCFWAAMLPLLVAYWRAGGSIRLPAAVGLTTTIVIVICCASSTPVVAVFCVVIGTLFFRLRAQMRIVRWTILITLVALHVVMKAPVWHLIARIDLVAGNTGWHRYHLIDQAIRHFDEWWLLGTPTTSHWGYGLADVTNEFVLQGVRGGLLTLVLFVAMVCVAFQNVGRLWRLTPKDPVAQQLAWALGICVFVHIMNFIAVSYFGQIMVVWYLTLAIIASLAPLRHARAAPGVRAKREVVVHALGPTSFAPAARRAGLDFE